MAARLPAIRPGIKREGARTGGASPIDGPVLTLIAYECWAAARLSGILTPASVLTHRPAVDPGLRPPAIATVFPQDKKSVAARAEGDGWELPRSGSQFVGNQELV